MRKGSKTDSIFQLGFKLGLFALLYITKQDVWPKTVYILDTGNSGKILVRLPPSLHKNTSSFVCDILVTELMKGSFQVAHFWKAYDSILMKVYFGFISSFTVNIFTKKVKFWMLYDFFWVILRRLKFLCQLFEILCLHRWAPVYEDGIYRVFRNVGIKTSDAGESHRKKHTKT